jgi:hypothetical protein
MTRTKATCLQLVLLSITSGQAGATWSIAAVDPVTREVGAAAATCTVDLRRRTQRAVTPVSGDP